MEIRYRGRAKGVGGSDGGAPEILLCRHGATAWDRGGSYDRSQGQLNYPPIDPGGVVEAEALREKLAGERITYVISSDTTRARQTAEILAFPHGEPVYGDPGWRAWDLGLYDGQAVTAERVREIAAYVIGAGVPPAGEAFAQFRGRAIRAMRYLFDLIVPGDRYVAVTHSHNVRLIDLWHDQGWRTDGLAERYHESYLAHRPIIKRGGLIRLTRGQGGSWAVTERWQGAA